MSELFHTLAFGAFASLTVISALLVVVLRNLLHAAVALFFSLTGVSALYILLGADFLGIVQLLIYAGGILVLIIFGVFLTARIYNTQPEVSQALPRWMGIGMGVGVFGLVATVVSKTNWPTKVETYEPTVHRLGELFLTKYLLPFELISVLLLFAMIGSVILVKKELDEE